MLNMRASGIKQFFLFEDNEKFNEAHGQFSVLFCLYIYRRLYGHSKAFTSHPPPTHTHTPVIL